MARHEPLALAAPDPAPAVLSLREVSVEFATRRGAVRALSEVSLDLVPGAVHVVIGESGSGKSVLARTVLDLLPRNATVHGDRRLAGTDLAIAGRQRWRELRSRRS